MCEILLRVFWYESIFQKSIFFQKNDNLVRKIVFLAKIGFFFGSQTCQHALTREIFLNLRDIIPVMIQEVAEVVILCFHEKILRGRFTEIFKYF